MRELRSRDSSEWGRSRNLLRPRKKRRSTSSDQSTKRIHGHRHERSRPLDNPGAGAVIGFASNSNIGGTEAGAGNVISANNAGVLVFGVNDAGNRVLFKSTFSDTSLGIDLGVDVPTANDPKDTAPAPTTCRTTRS